MKKFALHLFLTTAICLVLSNCRHELETPPTPSDCGEAQTIDEMMQWMYFKEGTYWIYEEQNSGMLDTVTVVDDYNGVSADGDRDWVCLMQSSNDGYFYKYWFNDSWSGDCGLFPGCYCRLIDCDKYIPGDYVGGNHNFIFPLQVGNRAGQLGPNLTPGATVIIESSDSISLPNSNFTNVYTFRMDFSIQHDRKLAYYKICRNFGIIVKEIPDFNQFWQLTECLIIQ